MVLLLLEFLHFAKVGAQTDLAVLVKLGLGKGRDTRSSGSTKEGV